MDYFFAVYDFISCFKSQHNGDIFLFAVFVIILVINFIRYNKQG